MADTIRLEDALIKAHNAGDTEAARVIAEELKTARGIPVPSTAESIAANPATRFALGAASPVLAATQGLDANTRTLSGIASLGPLGPLVRAGSMLSEAVMGRTPDQNVRELESMKKAGGHEGMDWAGLAGMVANPLAWRTGMSLKAPTSYPAKVSQGAAMGAGYGVSTPAVSTQPFEEEKGTQALWGAAVGTAIPAITGLVKGLGATARDVSDLFTKGGPQRIYEKYLDRILTKNDAERQQIIGALKQADEIVAGSKPTTAEAISHIPAASPLVEHQAIVSRTPGGPSGEFYKRTMDQEAARRGVLQTIGQDKQALSAAEGQRAERAAENYAAAEKFTVKPDMTFDALVKRPSMSRAMARAEELAKESGDTFMIPAAGDSKEFPVRSMHYVKMALDDIISNPERFGIGASEARSIGNTRNAFVSWLERKVPEYGKARTEYGIDSRVIDRMKIGQALEQKLVSASEKETPSTYANAVRNELQTLKKATGQPRYDELSQIMTPDEVTKINAVLADVQRKSRTFSLPQKTNLYGGVNVAEEVTPHVPNLLYRPAMITNFLFKKRASEIEKIIDDIAAGANLKPTEMAAILSRLPTAKRNAAMRGILDSRNPIITGLPVEAGILSQE